MKAKLLILTLLCLSLFLVGFVKPGPMVGTWVFKARPQFKAQIGNKVTAKLVFKGNGTFSGNIVTPQANSSVGGTYRLNGRALTIVTTQMNERKGSVTETATLSKDMKSFDMSQFKGYGLMVKQK